MVGSFPCEAMQTGIGADVEHVDEGGIEVVAEQNKRNKKAGKRKQEMQAPSTRN